VCRRAALVTPSPGADGARAAGQDDRQLRDILAGNANRIANGEPPRGLTPARGSDTFSQPMVMARIHQYLSMATPLLWARQPDTIGVLGLGLNATEEPNGAGSQTDLARIRDLLLCNRDLWRALPEIDDEGDRVRAVRLTVRLIHIADILAITAPPPQRA
jgi:hypothetical protein